MLASKYILKGAKNYDNVKHNGKMYQKPLFGIVILNRKDKEDSKFGTVVSTYVTKLAVQRNRIKRAIHQTVRYEMTRIKNGFDVVFLVKAIAAKKSTDEIMRETRKALDEVNLTK
jgi:ribonuclease P protein component